MNYDQYIGREVPANVAVCPICGAPLVIKDITEWDTDSELPTEDGTSFVCKSEPDIDSDDFSDWLDWHYQMPYVDWLPLNGPVHKWLTGVIVDDIIRSIGYDPEVMGAKYAELARPLIEAHKPSQANEEIPTDVLVITFGVSITRSQLDALSTEWSHYAVPVIGRERLIAAIDAAIAEMSDVYGRIMRDPVMWRDAIDDNGGYADET